MIPSGRDVLRLTVLVLLAAAPLPFGSVLPSAYVPLLLAAAAVGVASWERARRRRVWGAEVMRVPAWRALVALHGIVLLQLVPLPPRLLALLSPGSFAFYDEISLVPLRHWRPISVSPPDTARGLLFLAALSLLYSAVFREFDDVRWRRRLAATVIGTGFFITLVALAQVASGEPKIYGIFHPRNDWAIFGPYVSRTHFAGYVVMALPLALAFVVECVRGVARAWKGRRGWLSLGDTEGTTALRWGAAAMVLVIGLLGSQSRGGLMAFALSAVCLSWVLPDRRQAALLITAVAALGLTWVDPSGLAHGFLTRGVRESRLDLWLDACRLLPHYPLLGSGFNAFGTAYIRYQSLARNIWFGEAHNEYLQILLDTGVAGAAVAGALLAVLLRTAARSASSTTLHAGILGSLLGSCFSNTVDFNWQIPANAATFAAIAGLAMQGVRRPQ